MKRFHLITAIFAGVALLLLILLTILYLALLAYGAACINSQFFVPAICRGDLHSKRVAITFDDGPKGQRSSEILKFWRSMIAGPLFSSPAEGQRLLKGSLKGW